MPPADTTHHALLHQQAQAEFTQARDATLERLGEIQLPLMESLPATKASALGMAKAAVMFGAAAAVRFDATKEEWVMLCVAVWTDVETMTHQVDAEDDN